MNKKGFAISIILYSMVFLLITILFVILSILKTRYTASNDLRDSILKDFNEKNFGDVIFTKRLNQLQGGKCKWIDNMDTPSNTADDVYYVTACTSSYSPQDSDSMSNNYVWYSGKLWRIVAIYPDKTMKLVTEETITTLAWGASAEFNGSWIYQWLNEDFLDTLYNADQIVANTVWNYTTDDVEGVTSLNPPARPETLENQKTVTAKVGLLTRYEFWNTYSHDNYGRVTSSSKSYLNYRIGSKSTFTDYWWLLTPYNPGEVYVHYDNSVYTADRYSTKTFFGVRPSIKLKYGVKFTGAGTKANPYKIIGDKTSPVYNVTKLNTRSSGEYVYFDGLKYRIVEIENNNTRLVLASSFRIPSSSYNIGPSSSSVWGKSTNLAYDTGHENQSSYEYGDHYFNYTWYNSISNKYKNMMTDGTYYLRNPSNSYLTYKFLVCKDSNLENIRIKDCTKYTTEDVDKVFVGKVGLPRLGQMFSADIANEGANDDILLITQNYGALQYTGTITFNTKRGYYRPSITLKSTVKITGGTGTSDSPFEISE